MEQVHSTYEQIGDSNEKEIAVGNKMAGIPCNNEDSAGDDDTEDFGKTVKKKIAIQTGQIQSK
jgi:hypothetical protein